jgi:hypothetical protein
MTSSKAIFCVIKSLVVASLVLSRNANLEFKEKNKIELNDLWVVPIQTCTYIRQLYHPTKMATISQMTNLFLHFQQPLISVILWWSVLLVEENRVPRENHVHRPATSH